MKSYKVKTHYYVNKKEPTGTCAVLIRNHKRCLLPLLGAATKYPIDHLKENWKVVETSKVLYTTAYFVSTNYDALKKYADHAFEAKKVYSLLIIDVLFQFSIEYMDRKIF